MITQERLHELFDYREDGVLIWKKCTSFRTRIGDVAGGINPDGYRHLKIDEKNYRIHRLIFLYHHGYLTPGMDIDHIDGDKTNNRIENLRQVTKTQNQQNSKMRSTNTSGVKGVSWFNASGKWKAQLLVEKRLIYLGLHDTIEEAEKVIKEAREKYHGEYSRHE